MFGKPRWQLQEVPPKGKKGRKQAAKVQAKALKGAKLEADPKMKKAKNGVPLSKLRYPIPTPEKMVDDKGRVAVGTFDKEFPIINLLDAKDVGVPKFLNRAKVNKLLVQRYGTSLKNTVDRHTYNPKLNRIRRTMIKEGILTERLPEEEEEY